MWKNFIVNVPIVISYLKYWLLVNFKQKQKNLHHFLTKREENIWKSILSIIILQWETEKDILENVKVSPGCAKYFSSKKTLNLVKK